MNERRTAQAPLRIAGARVLLRPLEVGDAERVVRWRNDPAVAAQMFAPPPTLEQHLRWFERLKSGSSRQEFIIEAPSPEEVRAVGTIGLSAIEPTQRRAEYGILIGERAAGGRGIAFEASELLLDHAFLGLALERVFLQLFHDNIRALRLYEKLGFTHEGVLRRHAIRGGVREDVIVMGLLRDEWMERGR